MNHLEATTNLSKFASIDGVDRVSSIKLDADRLTSAQEVDKGKSEFSRLLKNSIDGLNTAQKNSDEALAEIATGEVKDLHQAAIAISKAETSMKLMLEVRNKAISAYKEILRTQI